MHAKLYTPTKQNIDCQEITKFEVIAPHWWDIEGDFKTLHRINPLRLNYIMQHAGGICGKKVLDVGCGGGILAESIVNTGGHVTGLDMGAETLQIARMHALKSNLNITYCQETVESHAQDNQQKYDIITCMEMLEHTPHPASVVRSCANLIKPGGHVFFSTLNRNIKSWLLAVIGAEYILRLIPKGTHDYKKFVRPSELIRWLHTTPIKEKHMVGIHYNPLTNHFKLGRNIDINYIIHMKHEG